MNNSGNKKNSKFYKYHPKAIDHFIKNSTVPVNGKYSYKATKPYINTSEWSDSLSYAPRVGTIVEDTPFKYNKNNNEKLSLKEQEKLKEVKKYAVLSKRAGYFQNFFYKHKYSRMSCILWITLEEHEKAVKEYENKYSIFNNVLKKPESVLDKLKKLQEKYNKKSPKRHDTCVATKSVTLSTRRKSIIKKGLS